MRSRRNSCSPRRHTRSRSRRLEVKAVGVVAVSRGHPPGCHTRVAQRVAVGRIDGRIEVHIRLVETRGVIGDSAGVGCDERPKAGPIVDILPPVAIHMQPRRAEYFLAAAGSAAAGARAWYQRCGFASRQRSRPACRRPKGCTSRRGGTDRARQLCPRPRRSSSGACIEC